MKQCLMSIFQYDNMTEMFSVFQALYDPDLDAEGNKLSHICLHYLDVPLYVVNLFLWKLPGKGEEQGEIKLIN